MEHQNDTADKGGPPDQPSRRTVLRGGVTALGTTLAFSSSASATTSQGSQFREAEVRYTDADRVERAVKGLAGEVVKSLRVETDGAFPTVSELSVDHVTADDAPSARSPAERTYIGSVQEQDVVTAHITIVRNCRDKVARLVLEPEAERAYAFLEHESGERIGIVKGTSSDVSVDGSSVGTDNVTTQGCTTEILCLGCCGTQCRVPLEYEKICCDDDFPGGCYKYKTGYCCSSG